jgi:hypothetical protein
MKLAYIVMAVLFLSTNVQAMDDVEKARLRCKLPRFSKPLTIDCESGDSGACDIELLCQKEKDEFGVSDAKKVNARYCESNDCD